jgi:ADP-ribose pyrophosphatase YjhB (NUDIX family)
MRFFKSTWKSTQNICKLITKFRTEYKNEFIEFIHKYNMLSINRAGILGKYKCSKTKSDYYLMVLNNDNGKWGFPKGHIEISENYLQCAQRECLEETGIFVKLTGEIGFKTNTSIYFLHYFDKLFKPNPQDLNEVRLVKWFSTREILGTNMKMFNADLITYVVKNLHTKDDGFSIVVNKKPKPRRNKQAICKYFVNGTCNKGNNCRFRH